MCSCSKDIAGGMWCTVGVCLSAAVLISFLRCGGAGELAPCTGIYAPAGHAERNETTVPPGSRESEIQRGENSPRPQGSSLLVEGGELGGTAEQLLRGSGL